MELIHPIFKWLHIIAGVLWIGLLYFFNWINGHVAATMDGDTKKKVVPELMPRTLYFFRWGAAWTWVTGVVLLLVVYYHGGLTFDDGDWSVNAFVMIAVTLLGVFLYDFLYKTGLAGNVRVITIISFVLILLLLNYCFYHSDYELIGYRLYFFRMILIRNNDFQFCLIKDILAMTKK